MRMRTFLPTAALLVALLAAPAAAAPPSAGPEAPSGSTGAPVAAAAPEAALVGITQIEVGYYNGCALLANRQVRCWGYGEYGENGDGTNDDGNTAVVVRNAGDTGPLVNVTQLAVGAYHACALLTNREVRCWGYGGDHSLGNNSFSDHNLPVPVLNPSGTGRLQNVTQIAAGSYNTCALLTSGQVRCWGQNDYGGAGNGDTSGDSVPLPTAVRTVSGPGPLTGVTQIDLGYHSACARLNNGQARCWGYGQYGNLGNGAEDDHSRPVVVKAVSGPGPLTGVTQVTAGEYNSCARLNNGQARCWGYAAEGANGTGGSSANPNRTRPAVVRNASGSGPLTNVVSISTGDYHTCALLSTGGGSVRCFGDNDYSQLGIGTAGGDFFRPRTVVNGNGVPSLTKVRQLVTNNYSTCVRLANGQPRCWGYNEYGSLGDGTYDDQSVPRKVLLS
jgi:alpha-tubulin suppressor-like RCC1 family protein